jgi:hypothetical protein
MTNCGAGDIFKDTKFKEIYFCVTKTLHVLQ